MLTEWVEIWKPQVMADHSGLSPCLQGLLSPSPLAVLSSAVVSWHEVSNSSSISSAKGLLSHSPLLAQLPSCPRPSCKLSTGWSQLKNDLLKTALKKLCLLLHHIHSVVGTTVTVHLRRQFEQSRATWRDGAVGKRRGGHQCLGLVLPPKSLSHKATKSWPNF